MESTRERSPNYPTVSLEDAVILVRRLYDAEKRASVALIVVAQALSGSASMKGLSGPARSKIAVLRSYGLIEDLAPGKVRVSDRALAILQRPTPATYTGSIREAALAPPLFRELYEEHRDASDGALKYHLMTDKKFTEDGANRAIKAYRETFAFANLALESYNAPAIPSDDVVEYVQKSSDKRDFPAQSIGQGNSYQKNSSEKELQMAYTWPLPDGVDAQVALLGNKPTIRALNRLIKQIEFMRDDLVEQPLEKTDGQSADSPAGD
jgi:hypothetical protein